MKETIIVFTKFKYLKDFSCSVCLLEVHSDEWKEENEKRLKKKIIGSFNEGSFLLDMCWKIFRVQTVAISDLSKICDLWY